MKGLRAAVLYMCQYRGLALVGQEAGKTGPRTARLSGVGGSLRRRDWADYADLV